MRKNRIAVTAYLDTDQVKYLEKKKKLNESSVSTELRRSLRTEMGD